ncbi:MAG: hypothetical protein HFF47_01405 [Lawsonibacter sp.]|nr:hypothetical protein [Lawsonibacter sp.]
MTGWGLPETVCVGGLEYQINADYRDILEVIEYLQAPGMDDVTRRYVAMSLFYEGFDAISRSDYGEAMEEMLRFINLGEDPEDGMPQPKTIDWEQDRTIIASEVNKVAGLDVRGLKFLHWWTFMGFFGAIGEGQLSMLVSIREKRRKGKKLEDWERDYYRRNVHRVEFRKKYTEAEEAIADAWGI